MMHKDNLNNMMCLDIYLAYSSDADYRQLKHRIRPLAARPHPVMSSGILCDANEARAFTEKEKDLQALRHFYEKYLWDINLAKLLEQRYEALVLTDATQTIQWVSAGFKSMTGYSPAYATGRSPQFLQGNQTSALSRKKLRQGLASGRPFTGTIVNYRSNGQQYLCQVSIYPLQGRDHNTTHFLALEKEIL